MPVRKKNRQALKKNTSVFEVEQQLDRQIIDPLFGKDLQIETIVWILQVEDVEIMVAVEAAVVVVEGEEDEDEDVAGNEGFKTTLFEQPSPL